MKSYNHKDFRAGYVACCREQAYDINQSTEWKDGWCKADSEKTAMDYDPSQLYVN